MKKLFVFIISVGLLLAILILLDKSHSDKFNKNKNCYTYTKSINVYRDSNGQKIIRYSFIVDHKEYKSIMQCNEERERLLKDKMKVEYICKTPKISKLVFAPADLGLQPKSSKCEN